MAEEGKFADCGKAWYQHEESNEIHSYRQRHPAMADHSVYGRRIYTVSHGIGISVLGGWTWQMPVYPGASCLGDRSGRMEALAALSGS